MQRRLLLSLLVVTLSPGAALADAIQSAAAQVFAEEGGTVTLRCSYNTSYNAAYYLYWYRQYRNRTLQYLLHRGAKTAKSASSTADFARERFSSETDDTSTELTIIALELADSAVYHCALQRHSDRVTRESCTKTPPACTRAARGDSIRPEEAQVSAAEGGTVTLRCFYTTTYSAGYYLYWYRQHRDRALQYILYREAKERGRERGTADFAEARFSSQTNDNSTVLNITSLELGDTAVYHCALRYAQRDSRTEDPHKILTCLHTQDAEQTRLQTSVSAITPPSSGQHRQGRQEQEETPP